MDYNLAYIPETLNKPHLEMFDTEYMRALYRTGYDLMLKGYPWAKEPPSFQGQPVFQDQQEK